MNTMVTPAEVLTYLQEADGFISFLANGWQEAQSAMPATIPWVLTPEIIAESGRWAQLEPDVVDRLIHAIPSWWANPKLKALIWHGIFHLNRVGSPQNFFTMPSLKNALGEDSGLPALAIGLSIVPTAVTSYRNQGLADETIRQTLQEIRCFCNNHRVSNHNQSGILWQQLHWLTNYRDGKLVRLGRLEYRLGHAGGFGVCLRRKTDGAKLLLAEDGRRFDRHGLIDTPAAPDEQGWTATMTETAVGWVGYPLHPSGYAVKEKAVLPNAEWELLFRRGDPVIDMHIPSGGGLSPEACRESFALAAEFFTSRNPGIPLRAFWCTSWIFNPQLEEKMPDSNLAALQRELYLFPQPSSGRDGLFFVFCQDPADLSGLPRQTSLQRTMLEILESGRRLRSCGMVLTIDELAHYGQQTYRRNYPLEHNINN